MAQSSSSPVQVVRDSAFTLVAFLLAALTLAASAPVSALTVNVTGTMTVSGSIFVTSSAAFYTVVLTNSGTAQQSDNPGPEFTDVLPPELTLFFASANFGTASFSGNTVTWNGQIPAGGSITIFITAIVSPPVGDCPNLISNQGTISYDADANGTNESTALTDDPGTAAANDPTSFNFIHGAVFTVTKAVTGTPRELQNLTYTVVATNSGCGAQPDDPGTPEFSDFLPSSLTLVSAGAVGNPGPAGTTTLDTSRNRVTWDGVIPPGGTVTITIVARVNPGTAGQTISNQGVVSEDADSDGIADLGVLTDDPATPAAGDPTNVVVQAPSATQVTGTETVSGAFYTGSALFYTVVLTNSGTAQQSDNPGPEFTDVLPPELTLLFASANFGTASFSGNTVTWNGQIPAGGSATIFITANVSATVGDCPSVISNQGTIFYDADANGTNESTALTDDPGTAAANDPTSFNLIHAAVITATKAVTGTPRELQNISYTVVITNSGCGAQPNDPSAPEFSDFLPSSLTLVSAGAIGNPGPAGTTTLDTNRNLVTWDGVIPSGGTVTITIVARVNPGTAGQTISNQGVVSYDINGDGLDDTGFLTDDPATPADGDPTSVVAQGPLVVQVPTLSGLGLAALALALTGTALLLLRRRRSA